MYAIHEYYLALANDIDHRAPITPYSIIQAHSAMQLHVECLAGRCPAKGTALRLLIEEGRVVPDPDGWKG